MLAALALTLPMLLAARARPACPAACRCAQLADGPDELACAFPAGKLTLQVRPHRELDITCEDGLLRCPPDELPQLKIARNESLAKLQLKDCTVRGPLACWVRAAGARGVHKLVLDGGSGALAAEDTVGLAGVRELTVLCVENCHNANPLGALAVLPSVEQFQLHYAALGHLAPLPPLRALRHLDLVYAGIEALAPAAFPLGNLQVLLLANNHIEKITEHTFKGLRALRSLDLSANQLAALPARALRPLARLADLSVGFNYIRQVDSDAFYGLQDLRKIEASENHVPLLLSPRCLADLPALREVRLDNSQIASLPPDLLRNSTRLKTLSLAGNLIHILPDGLFWDQQSLITLNLSRNKIEQLASDVFHSLENLLHLNLDYNFISELKEDQFAGLSGLRTLSINNNRLRHITGAFGHAAALTHVSLADNQLSFPHGQTPLNVLHSSLERLDLSGNNISCIASDLRTVLTRLALLNLSRNAIESLADADLYFYSKNILVDLRNNQIARVVLSDPTTEALYRSILMDNNPLICDCKNQKFFEYIKAITKLDVGTARCVGPPHLSRELVKNINPRILTCDLNEGCPHQCSCAVSPAAQRLELTCAAPPAAVPDPAGLTEYSLRSTTLTLTSSPTYLNLPNHVDILILSNLSIRELLPVPHSVHYIDLTYNSLVEIPVELLQRNITLKLSGNPFACDCSHYDDVQILKNYKQKVLDHSSVTCSDQQSPWQIDTLRLCSVQHAVIIGGSLVALSLTLIALASLCCRYATQIKIILYSCDKLRWLIAEENVDRDKKYDAFVSFSHKDEKFVAENLVPVLESGPQPLKLCVHYRDWVVGEWIPAQIVTSVEQSRRTIIILSKSFIESVWGIMEFRVAYKRAQEDGRARLIVVLLEDAPPEASLDPELRAYLSTNTYVRWGDPWFWQKLRYALAGGRVARRAETASNQKFNAKLNSHGQIVKYTSVNCT